MRNILQYIVILLILFCYSCIRNQKAKPDPLISNIDSSIKPGDDFFQYANGKWFKKNPIPANKNRNGLWDIIQDTINSQIRDICNKATLKKNVEKGTNEQKIRDFYISGMDSAAINKNWLSDINKDLVSIDNIQNTEDLTIFLAYLHTIGVQAIFEINVRPDNKICTKNAVFLSQNGLSLPDRSYYLDKDKYSISLKQKYKKHLFNIFKILNYNEIEANKAINDVLEIESLIAKASRNNEEIRDEIKNYNKISFNKLNSDCKNFNWKIFFYSIHISNLDTVIICQPEFFKIIDNYLLKLNINKWKNYIKYHYISHLSDYLGDKLYSEFQSFYSKEMEGIEKIEERSKRVVEKTNFYLGEVIGQIYVKEYLPEGSKEKLLEIGNEIKNVYAERIKNLDWMSNDTKIKALKKLNKITMKVGYPDKWKDMSMVIIDKTSYVKNVINIEKWMFNHIINRYGKPIDKSEWVMTPQTYNAYYHSSYNEIVIPGCNILVPGYEKKLADDAILYAIIGGSIFGHEITHGFDDQGSKFDELGNMNNWWTLKDSINYYNKTKLIIKQFDDIVAIDSIHINGKLTLGENIADLGGIIFGYEAYKKTDEFKRNISIEGYKPNQRFFLAYALSWMINSRPETIRNMLKADEHSPAKFRVNGPLSNLPEFYDAFNIKAGDKMWKPDSLRVKIW